jgi:hypothetical protein
MRAQPTRSEGFPVRHGIGIDLDANTVTAETVAIAQIGRRKIDINLRSATRLILPA